MDNNQDFVIVKHLTNLIEDLEQKLAFPKNTWKRKEQLQAEIAEAKQRLETVSGHNRKRFTTRDRRNSHRVSSRQRDESQKPSRPRLIEVNYL